MNCLISIDVLSFWNTWFVCYACKLTSLYPQGGYKARSNEHLPIVRCDIEYQLM